MSLDILPVPHLVEGEITKQLPIQRSGAWLTFSTLEQHWSLASFGFDFFRVSSLLFLRNFPNCGLVGLVCIDYMANPRTYNLKAFNYLPVGKAVTRLALEANSARVCTHVLSQICVSMHHPLTWTFMRDQDFTSRTTTKPKGKVVYPLITYETQNRTGRLTSHQ